MLRSVAGHFNIALETPYKNLPEDFRKLLMYGSGEDNVEFKFWRAGKVSSIDRPFEGVLVNLERLTIDSESEFMRNRLKAYMSPQFCDVCGGKRLKPEILAVTLGGEEFTSQFKAKRAKIKIPGLSVMDVCALSVEKADDFFTALKLTEFQQKIAGEVIKEIRARLGFLKNVGLGYLTLDRESGTLSGGEAQRIRLATQIGAALVGVLYVLDEPSVGLHARDNARLIEAQARLRDLGNTIIVVEHDREAILAADHVVDMGPGAGVHGGEIVAQGSPAELMKNPASVTGPYLSGAKRLPIPKKRKTKGKQN